jgi:GMP synthase-like glutamine amidotransferase
MARRPRILILDNSPRHLGMAWFGKWFRALGCAARAYHALSGSLPTALDDFDGVVLSGSPASALQDDPWIGAELRLVEQAERQGLAVLGICFGSQLLARAHFGPQAVRRSRQPEFGWQGVEVCRQDALLAGAPRAFTTFQYHMEEVVPQPGMHILATSPASAVQGFRIGRRPIWGLQFHLEVTPRAGLDLLRKTEHVYRPHGFQYMDLAGRAQPCAATARVLSNFARIAHAGK